MQSRIDDELEIGEWEIEDHRFGNGLGISVTRSGIDGASESEMVK